MAQKNHTFLLDVFAEVLKIDSQAHLVLLGDGELMDEIKRKTADLGISEHVTCIRPASTARNVSRFWNCTRKKAMKRLTAISIKTIRRIS